MWFFIAVIAFFFLALASVIDKFLLTKTKIVPVSFAFFISLGGLLTTILLIFEKNFFFPQAWLLEVVLGGLTYFFGLYFMFKAVAVSEISKSNPLIVSLTPIAAFLLSWSLGLDLLKPAKILGVILIIIGSYYLSQVGSKNTRINKKAWLYIIIAGLLLGATNVYSKIAYDNLPFINALVWLRWSSFVIGVIFVSLIGKWPEIFFKNKEKKVKTIKLAWLVFVIGQVAGSIGVMLQQWAIDLGNVILVSALNGLQFFFVILLVYLFSKFMPQVIKEDVQKKYLAKKIIWSVFLFIGLVLILV